MWWQTGWSDFFLFFVLLPISDVQRGHNQSNRLLFIRRHNLKINWLYSKFAKKKGEFIREMTNTITMALCLIFYFSPCAQYTQLNHGKSLICQCKNSIHFVQSLQSNLEEAKKEKSDLTLPLEYCDFIHGMCVCMNWIQHFTCIHHFHASPVSYTVCVARHRIRKSI